MITNFKIYELKKDFKYNTQNKEQIVTKSGLESTYIDFFEENKIPWSYEEVALETIKKDGFHVPDFIIEIDKKKIMLEVKGNFYRQEIKEYLGNKVQAAINYSLINNMQYVLTTIKNPNLEYNFIEKSLINKK